MKTFLCTLVCAFLSACSSSTGDGGTVTPTDTGATAVDSGGSAEDSTPSSRRSVTIYPVNGASNYSGTLSLLITSNESPELDLPAIKAGISLLTSPARTALPVVVTTEHVGGPEAAGAPYGDTRVDINPNAPLPTGTFIVHVDKLPAGYFWTPTLASQVATDGSLEIQFTTSSSPRLSRVSVCTESGGAKVRLGFSEVLGAATAEKFLLEYADLVAGHPSCSWIGPATASAEYAFNCELQLTRPLAVAIQPGLSSMTGTAVLTNRYEVNFSTLSADSTGCRVHNF